MLELKLHGKLRRRGRALQRLFMAYAHGHYGVNRLAGKISPKKKRIAGGSDLIRESNVGTILLGILVVIGPSVAAVAWLIWYSGSLESSGRDRQDEPWVGS